MAKRMEGFHEGSTDMDARIWGNLGNHIDLAMIYVKLPIGEFFRLRQVCKEWNRLASDRKFLEESFRGPIPEPYFVVDSDEMGHRLLARDASSGRWSWTRLPNCAVAGLLCKYRETSNSNCVFNLHTRVFHALPPAPRTPEKDVEFESDLNVVMSPQEGMVAIEVDSPEHPYGFKVFLGVYDVGTRIYDSKCGAWTQMLPLHDFSYLALDSEHQKKPYSIFCTGVLYFRVWNNQRPMVYLQPYYLERDAWQIEAPWEIGQPYIDDHPWAFCDIGVWEDRFWNLEIRLKPRVAITVLEYSVGAYCEYEGCWDVSDRMPEDLSTWLIAGQEGKVADFDEEIEMQGVFCGEYVLVYNCAGDEDVTERAVLYNLEGKTWEKLQLPPSWPRKVKPIT